MALTQLRLRESLVKMGGVVIKEMWCRGHLRFREVVLDLDSEDKSIEYVFCVFI